MTVDPRPVVLDTEMVEADATCISLCVVIPVILYELSNSSFSKSETPNTLIASPTLLYI